MSLIKYHWIDNEFIASDEMLPSKTDKDFLIYIAYDMYFINIADGPPYWKYSHIDRKSLPDEFKTHLLLLGV